MNDDISKLEKLLNPNAFFKASSGKCKVKLSETKKKYSIYVKNVPNNTLVIRADNENFPPRKIINCHDKGFCKLADYILVNEDETVFVELKHGKINGRAKNIIKQLKGAKCLLDYLVSVGRQFFSNAKFLEIASKKQHFVVILIADSENSETPAGKKRESNNSPQKMARIKAKNGDSLDYSRLFYQ